MDQDVERWFQEGGDLVHRRLAKGHHYEQYVGWRLIREGFDVVVP